MAMFPCITGIPTKLNSDMQAVLNKKMGTSGQTYPSQTWADEVNLMGKLPEKTASGSIASFNDGADDVPVKSAKFYFLPQQASGTPSPSNPLSITGWTGLTTTKVGKNLIKLSADSASSAQRCSVTYTISGAEVTAEGTYARSGCLFAVKTGVTYTISFTGKSTGDYNRVALNDKDGWSSPFKYINLTSTETQYTYTFTASTDVLFFGMYVTGGGTTGVMTISDLQLETGSTATTYAHYVTPETLAVSWQTEAGTIYSGYVDATRGKVVKTHESVDLGTLDWTIVQTLQEERAFYTGDLASVIDPPSSNLNALDGYCENLPVNSQNNVMNTSASGICSNTSGTVYVFNYTYASMTKEQFTTAVTGSLFVYPLATPVEYDITAFIPSTYLGSNNFYSDANGDTEITYRADISLALSALGGRGLSMMRPVNTEEIEFEEGE